MFTDKRHSRRGIFSCVLGVSGLAAFIGCIARVYAAGGEVRRAQSATLMLAAMYGVTGLVLGVWMLVRGDTFRLFPGIGVALNAVLLGCLAGLLVLGLT